MPVEGRPTRVHGLVAMVYENGGAMVLPNYGMNDPAELDRLPNRALVEEEGFGFDELLELTSLAEQAGLLEPIVDLEEDREQGEGGEVQVTPITTLYGLTAEGTAVARERAASAADARGAPGTADLEEAIASAVERGVAGGVEGLADASTEQRSDDREVDRDDRRTDEDGTDRDGGVAERGRAVALATGSDAVARAVAAFAVALVLVATADATRELLLGALPRYRTVITAGLLSVYAVVLLFVVRTAYRVGQATREDDGAADAGEGPDEDPEESDEGEDDDEDDDGEERDDGEDDGDD